MSGCVPYNGPHLNESAWQNIGQNTSVLICQDMVPRRCDPNTLEYVPAQGTAPPFKITTKTLTANTGSALEVLVSGEIGFNSVYMQARHGDKPAGHFLSTQDTFTSNCSDGQNNAAIFSSKALVKHATITWIAPEYPVRIQFRATISRSFQEFWVGVTSATVTVKTTPRAEVQNAAMPTRKFTILTYLCSTALVLHLTAYPFSSNNVNSISVISLLL